jgi:Domain of unknown function (DUF397)
MERVSGATWRTSSYSGANGGNCVEAGVQENRFSCDVLVRDTKDSVGPVLRFTPDAWRRFTGQMKVTA